MSSIPTGEGDLPALDPYESDGRLAADCPGCGMQGSVTKRPGGLGFFDCDGKCGAGSGVYRLSGLTAEPIGRVTGIRSGRRSRSLLSSPPPEPGSSRDELVGWLTVQLGVGGDPIRRAERYGRSEDSRLVIVLDSGTRITYDRAAQLFEAPVLVRRVVLATGATVPTYGNADAQAIATAIVRAAETLAVDDDRGEAREWGRTFLAGAAANTISVSSFSTPAGRWEALCALASQTPRPDLPPYAPAAERAALILDGVAGDRMVRTSDFAAHVRGMAGRPITWAALHGRMSEVGWEHVGELHQRQPRGEGRAKAHVYVVRAGWEVE